MSLGFVVWKKTTLEFDTEYKVKGVELGDVKIGVVPFRLGEGQMQTGVCVWWVWEPGGYCADLGKRSWGMKNLAGNVKTVIRHIMYC